MDETMGKIVRGAVCFIRTGSTCGSVSVWFASNERTPGSTSASVATFNTVGASSRYSVVLGRANARLRWAARLFRYRLTKSTRQMSSSKVLGSTIA